ncbi:MAG: hypothetical protein ACYSU5_18275 [Planctomycetota bacterium]
MPFRRISTNLSRPFMTLGMRTGPWLLAGFSGGVDRERAVNPPPARMRENSISKSHGLLKKALIIFIFDHLISLTEKPYFSNLYS